MRNKRIKSILSLLLCVMMLLPQFAFALEESAPAESVTDAQTLPDMVTGELNLTAGSEYAGGRTEITGGPVRGPLNGTASIRNYTFSNKAANTYGGGANASGSAFISRGANSLVFENVTINSKHMDSLVFNIWANSSISAQSVAIDGRDFLGKPFLLIGAYPNGRAGTLDLSGTNAINDMTNTRVCGGSSNSVMNVNSGSLTIKNSSFSFDDGVRLIVKSGASLIVKGTTELSGTKPTIQSGAILDLTGSNRYTLSNVGSSFNFEDGAILKLREYTIHEVVVGNGESAVLSTENGEEKITMDPAASGGRETIGGKSVKVTADDITVADGAAITVESGGTLTFDHVTLEGRGNITVKSGGKAFLKGTNAFHECTVSNSGAIYVEGESAAIEDSSLNFTGSSGLIIVEQGKTLAIGSSTVTPSGKQQIQVYGMLDLGDTEADLSGNGAIRWIRIEDGGTADLHDSALSGSTSLGVIRANAGSTLKIENSTFENNRAAGSGEQNNGGVILAWSSDIKIKDSVFTGNSSAAGGGVIWAQNCTLDVSGSEFSSNNARGHGGAVYQSGGAAAVDASEFDGNTAEDGLWAHGGAICTMGSGAELTIGGGSSFTGNRSHLGAAVIVLNGATGHVNEAVFENNEVINPGGYGNDGGSLFVAENSTLYLPNASIHDNHAAGGGSGLYVCGSGTAKVMAGAAAIYDNENGDFMQRHYEGGTKTEVFDEALGGGMHNWTWTESGDGHNVLYAESDLTSRPADGGTKPMLRAASDGSAKADVVIKNNKSAGVGAGLGGNGSIVIGDRTQIRIYKVWNDNSNASGRRLSAEEFLAKLQVYGTNGKVDLSGDGIEIKVHKSGEFDAFTEVVEAAKAGRTEKVTATEDNWVIDITGLSEDEWPYTVYEGDRPDSPCSEYYLPPAGTDPATDRELGFTGIKNTYAEGKAVIEGTKTLKGRTLKKGEFTFILWNDQDEEVGRAVCGADGSFAFDLTYTLKDLMAAREYSYYVTEVKGKDDTVKYDDHQAKVTVKLAYTYGETEIKTEVTYEDPLKFENEASDSGGGGDDTDDGNTDGDDDDSSGSKDTGKGDDGSGSKDVATGDDAPIAVFLALLAVCATAAAGLTILRRKQR